MELQRRKRNRIKNYDYDQSGAYFITICVKDKRNLLWADVGAVINRPNNTPELSQYGLIMETAISNISRYYKNIIVDKYIIMPNHIHMILLIRNEEDAGSGRLIIAPTVLTVIQQLKRYTTKQIGFPLWQKSFHDHIIRDEDDYLRIWEYIETNPLKWQEDCYYEP